MDKEKSEQLKEILNKTLSKDDIEKKLKKETKVLALKKKQKRETNLTLYLVSIIAILLITITVYLFIKDNTKQQEISIQKKETSIVKKQNIDEKPFKELITLEKENYKELYNPKKFNTFKCYNFKAGDIFPNTKCKTDLNIFLKTNKTAIKFEIIPIISKVDNKILEEIKLNLSNKKQSFQNKIQEYMFRSLGKQRVIEISQQVKDILGNNVVLSPTKYYIKSEKNKGIIIKAYH